MSNNLMVFEGKEVEVFEFEGQILFNPKHVAECLDIKNVNENLRNMNNKQVIKLTNSKISSTDFRKLHNTGENFLTESGVYKLIFKSRKEEAERFQDWVTDEVLPSIRKTGTYSTKSKDESEIKYMNAQARLKNARAREAKIYLELADKVSQAGIPEFAQVMYSKTTELISGEALIPLPKREKKTYSATEIGKILGISANKVGGLANAYNLKTDEYGIKVWDKAKYSDKQVPNFRYYENVIPVLEKALNAFEN
ncbi:toxin Bro [Clostridioides difficile]|uniref:BRO-N domain-containing protein n=1 Tax=Clostridioides difficile TaxID=1496 RepID=UPI0014302846|nr:BRO family protein [Clostridioides difficile]MCB4302974.1 toxin Bro [Clostridioides difficile]MCM0744875.1 toxin Bro [Clostridioides difficile]MCP8332052.1 BRO family protein [Clostridioides difficile]MCP8338086.1 BRO family protein [Clostridioides difficile]MCP8381311.1 BRO family protein [Clostridioides difficile]